MDNQNAQMCIKFLAPGFITPHPKSIDEKMGSSTILHMRDEQVKVIKLSPSLVVKCGTGVTEAEAKALLLISEKAPNVPVPKVLAYYTYGPVDKRLHGIRRPVFETFIFMSYVEGERLKVAWEAYDTTAKRRVADQLKTYLCDLRGITGGKYIGSVNQGPLKDRILFDSFNKGPFPSEDAFNNAIIECYKYNAPLRSDDKFLRTLLSQKQHRIVFTHGDLSLDNIIVKDGNVTGIVGWTYSGWLPEYWEFSRALYSWTWKNDRHEYLVDIMTPYYAEHMLFLFLAERLIDGKSL